MPERVSALQEATICPLVAEMRIIYVSASAEQQYMIVIDSVHGAGRRQQTRAGKPLPGKGIPLSWQRKSVYGAQLKINIWRI